MFQKVRDWALFFGGLTVALWEVFTHPDPNIAVLGLAGTMMGVPWAQGIDRKQKPDGESAKPSASPSEATPTPPRG